MHKDSDAPGWFARWSGATRPPQDDPADLGTAFGLDMSLRALADEAQASTTPPRAVAASARRRDWMQRLGARRRPAA